MDAPRPLGRERELDAIRGALADVAQHGLRVVVVEGEAGIGKTSVVRAALAEAKPRVVWATGDESEADLDQGIVGQLVRAGRLEELARQDLADVLGPDPLATGAAIVRLIDGMDIDPGRPLVVVVDDAQWADPGSLQALAFAARRVHRDPVLWCLVVRGRLEDLPAGVQRLVDDRGLRLPIGPLHRAAVQELVERERGEPVPPAVADRLRQHTHGNPLHLRALVREASTAQLASVDDLPAPRSYAALVLDRVAGASADCRALLDAVAVLGDATPLALASEVAGVEEVAAVADEAAGLGLLAVLDAEPVTAQPRRTSLAHPLVRAALLGALPVARRTELHRRAGERLPGVIGLRHRLRGATGPDPDLWQEARLLARSEAARGAHTSAASLLGLAAQVADGAPDRELTAQEALQQHLLAGDVGAAAALVPEVEAASPSAARSCALGRAAYVLGPRRSTTAHLLEAWERVGGAAAEDHELAGDVAALLGTVEVDRGRGEDALRWSETAMRLAPERAALSSSAHMLASAHALLGTMDDGLRRLDALCAEVAGPLGGIVAADALSARGLLRLWTHQLPLAADDFEASLAAMGDRGTFVARETARFYLAEVRYRQGRWDDSILHALVSSSVVDDSGQTWLTALPHATAARPLAARGEPAQQHLDLAAAAAAQVGAGVAAVLSQVAALEVAAARRDAPAVVALGDALLGGPIDERIAPWRASYAEALVAADRVEDAAAVVAELAASPSTPLVATDLGRAAAAVAAAIGREEGLHEASAALDLDPELVGPYPRARLELVLGRAWRRRGARRRAMTLLEAAGERFRSLGAEPWLDQVDREVTASGLRPLRGRARAGTVLTPQEQAVAGLVARGLTNREVGTELVVSAKTVEHHLSRIYAKLGVRSRTELAGRLRLHP